VIPSGSDFALQLTRRGPVPVSARLDCEGGRLLALVGPSGSGKSTLLRLIAGLARADAGRITCGSACWFDSERAVNLTPQQRNVGFVPQSYGLFPHLSALENIEAGLDALDRTHRRERALLWLAKVNLGELRDRRPAQLSGGEQQRVALARALAREPSILLLDEPFSAVDRPTRERLYLELAELKQELAIPIVMVTHDLTEAMLLADRIALLDRGRTLQAGTPAEVVARPGSETAARMVGISNIFDGEVLRYEDETCICWIRVGQLEVAVHSAQRPQQAKVRWVVPNASVRLPGIRYPTLSSGRNRCRILIRSVLPLGEQARLVADLEHSGESVELQIPARLIEALALAPGSGVDVSLREEALHILPPPEGSSDGPE
jgi:molybdate transport system ATP-binding protein